MEKGANYIQDKYSGNFIKVTAEQKEHILKVQKRFPTWDVKSCLNYRRPPVYTHFFIQWTSEDSMYSPCTEEQAKLKASQFRGEMRAMTANELEQYNWYHQ